MDAFLAQRRLKDAHRVLHILAEAGFRAMLAGGCVRDRLLGFSPKDFDVATTATPPEAVAALHRLGIKTVPTGIEHGTITAIMPAGPVELTTLRTDTKTDGRHAAVAFSDSFAADAARRDFTINALFQDAEGTVHDFCNGQADLSARILRFVGDPAARIREDYLRILRFFRFWARLNFTPDAQALKAIGAEHAGLRRLSQERVTGELLQIIAAPFARAAMHAMAQTGVWQLVVPELLAKNQQTPPDLSAAQPLLQQVEGDRRPMAALALLLLAVRRHDVDPEDFAKRLKLSRSNSHLLIQACARFAALAQLPKQRSLIMEVLDELDQAGGDASFELFFYPVWQAAIAINQDDSNAQQLSEALNMVAQTALRFDALRRQKLPISGNLLMQVRPNLTGKDLGIALKALKRAFRDGLWQEADDGLRWLDEQGPGY